MGRSGRWVDRWVGPSRSGRVGGSVGRVYRWVGSGRWVCRVGSGRSVGHPSESQHNASNFTGSHDTIGAR